MKTKLKISILVVMLITILALVSCSFKGCSIGQNTDTTSTSTTEGTHQHTVVIDQSVAATCNSTGLTEGQRCSDCGEIIVAQELIIPQHNFVKNNETQLFSCSECKATVYNGHIYATFDVFMSWYQAYELCDSLGGHLVTINSQGEQDFLNTLIANAKYPEGIVDGYYFWSGGIYNGEWKWITGEEFDYTNWGAREPDDKDVKQLFIAIASNTIDSSNSHNSIGKWEDFNHFSNGLYGVICEWEIDIDENEHYFTEWVTVTEADCFIDGERTRQCTHCGLVETEVIPMIEHNFIFNESTGVTCCEYCNAAKYNGHIYMIFNESLTWFSAYTKCEEIGGHLVTITSKEEQTFIENYMRSLSFSKSAWMGGYHDGEKYQWVTGEQFNYTHWGSTQPDCSAGKEYFTEINYSDSLGVWNDVSMNNSGIVAFICEWETEN